MKKRKKSKYERTCERCGNEQFQRKEVYKCIYCGLVNGIDDDQKRKDGSSQRKQEESRTSQNDGGRKKRSGSSQRRKEKIERIRNCEEIESKIAMLQNEKEKNVLTYRYIDKMQFWKIAQIMGYSESTIYNLHRSALKKIKI